MRGGNSIQDSLQTIDEGMIAQSYFVFHEQQKNAQSKMRSGIVSAKLREVGTKCRKLRALTILHAS